jgi:hypothetical protein
MQGVLPLWGLVTLGSMLTSTSSTSGMIATVAVEVCTRPEDSVAGTCSDEHASSGQGGAWRNA